MKPITIDIVRHGETFLNVLDRMQGWCDYDLNERGRRQARITGQALANRHYDLVVSSDLRRATQTRDLIVEMLKFRPAKVEADRQFREMCFGVFEGLDSDETWAKIAHQFGYQNQSDIMKHRGMTGALNLLHQADSTKESDDAASLSHRWSAGIFDIIQNVQPGGRVLIVTHGTFIRALAEELGVDTLHNYPVNAGVTTVQTDSLGKLTLIEYNHHFGE